MYGWQRGLSTQERSARGPHCRAQLLSGHRPASSRFRCLHPGTPAHIGCFSAGQHLHPAPGTPELRMGPWTLCPEKKADHPALEWLLPARTPQTLGHRAEAAASQAREADAPPDQAARGRVVTFTHNLGAAPTGLCEGEAEPISQAGEPGAPRRCRPAVRCGVAAPRLAVPSLPSRCPHKALRPCWVLPPLFLAQRPGDTAQPKPPKESVLQERGRVSSACSPPPPASSQPPTSGGISYWSAVKNVPASGSR